MGVFLSRKRLSKSHIEKSYEHNKSSRIRKKMQNIETLFHKIQEIHIIHGGILEKIAIFLYFSGIYAIVLVNWARSRHSSILTILTIPERTSEE